jgi:hypothetical protein
MPESLSDRDAELLSGRYDCADRIVLTVEGKSASLLGPKPVFEDDHEDENDFQTSDSGLNIDNYFSNFVLSG